MASIVEQTFSADGADKKLVLVSGEQFIGKLVIGASWTDIRIGMHVQIEATANVSAAIGVIGLCASLGATAQNVRGFGDNACDHFVGMGFTGALNAGQTLTFGSDLLAPEPFKFGKKVGAAVTNVTPANSSTCRIPSTSGTARRAYVLVRITKGAPNYSFTAHGLWSGAFADVTRAQFLEAMAVNGDPTLSGFNVVKYTGVVPVTEGDGGLDCVNVSWNKSVGLHLAMIKVWRFS